MWLPQLGCYGYQMLTQLKHVLIFHGGGVGGGSLVYANQQLIPPGIGRFSSGRKWGIPDCKATMMPHYQEARRILGSNPSPQVGRADECRPQVGIDMRGKDTFHKNDVGIFFGEPDKTVPDPYFGGRGPRAHRLHLLRLLHGGLSGGG